MKRCSVCDTTATGESIYHAGITDTQGNSLEFTEDGEGNILCSSCADIIRETLNEMEEADEEVA